MSLPTSQRQNEKCDYCNTVYHGISLERFETDFYDMKYYYLCDSCKQKLDKK